MLKLTFRKKEDLKKIFNLYPDVHIFGIGLTAFLRSHIAEEIRDRYTIIAFDETTEINIIKKKFNVITLREIIGDDKRILKKNGSSIVSHPKVQAFINQYKSPAILSYKGIEKISKLCKEKGWIYLNPQESVSSKLFEDKTQFRRLFPIKSLLPRSLDLPAKDFSYKEIVSKLGKKFVIQDPNSSGGKGTYFVKNRKDYRSVYKNIANLNNKNKLYLISEFIEGLPASVIGVATRWGSFSSSLQIQLQDIPSTNTKSNNSGVFNGHDWTASQTISKKLQSDAKRSITKLGEIMYAEGFRGFFGIDVIINQKTDQLYVIECNPRLTGTLPTIDMIQQSQEKVSFSSLHLLEMLSDKSSKFEIDSRYIQKQLDTDKSGSHLLLYSPFASKHTIDFNLRPGVYGLKGKSFMFKREGFQISDINNRKEYIITELASKSVKVKQYDRVARILSKESLVTSKYKIKKDTEKLVSFIYKQIL